MVFGYLAELLRLRPLIIQSFLPLSSLVDNLPEKQIIAKLEEDVAELKRDKVAYNH